MFQEFAGPSVLVYSHVVITRASLRNKSSMPCFRATHTCQTTIDSLDDDVACLEICYCGMCLCRPLVLRSQARTSFWEDCGENMKDRALHFRVYPGAVLFKAG